MMLRSAPRAGAPLLATLVATLLAALPCGTAAAASIEVHVSPVADNDGTVNVAVCDRERFLKQCAYSAAVPAQAGTMKVVIDGVPAGSWAVLAYHDANANSRLDRSAIGVPTEKYGFSRDARNMFGPPTFDKAAIEVGDGPTVAPIRLR